MRIHHEEVGTGEPVVLVHGWGVDHVTNWVATGWVDALAGSHRVVLLDVRGHGRSEKPLDPGAYGYRAMAADVVQVLDARGIDQATVIGHSMGAFIAVAMLGHHAGRVRAAVLSGIGDETAESAAAAVEIAAALRAPRPADVEGALGAAYRAFVDAQPTSDREALAVAALQMWPEGHPLAVGGPGLAAVEVPVLIVNGADDHPYVESAARLAAAIPGAELVVVPDADHLSIVSDPRAQAAALVFLARAH